MDLPEHPGQRASTVAFWEHKAALHGGAVEQDGPLVRVTLGFDEPQWNGAWLLAPADDEGLLARTSGFFARHGKPWGLLTPQGLPGRLTAALAGARVNRIVQRVMVAPLTDDVLARAAATTRSVEIRTAGPDDVAGLVAASAEPFEADPETLTRFTAPEIGAEGFTHLAAVVDEVVVGAATLALHEGMAGVYGVAVLVDQRRRGVGTALTARCLQLGARAGCAEAYLNPSDLSGGVYRALGFTDAAGWDVWLPPR